MLTRADIRIERDEVDTVRGALTRAVGRPRLPEDGLPPNTVARRRKMRDSYQRRRQYNIQYRIRWNKLHREQVRNWALSYRDRVRRERPDLTRLRSFEWRRLNPEGSRRAVRKWTKSPKGRFYHSRDVVICARRLRFSLRQALLKLGTRKSHPTFELLSYSPSALRAHLAYYLGRPCVYCGRGTITLQNAHIDHVIPLNTARTIDEMFSLFRLRNLRLIHSHCNLSKGSKYEVV